MHRASVSVRKTCFWWSTWHPVFKNILTIVEKCSALVLWKGECNARDASIWSTWKAQEMMVMVRPAKQRGQMTGGGVLRGKPRTCSLQHLLESESRLVVAPVGHLRKAGDGVPLHHPLAAGTAADVIIVNLQCALQARRLLPVQGVCRAHISVLPRSRKASQLSPWLCLCMRRYLFMRDFFERIQLPRTSLKV